MYNQVFLKTPIIAEHFEKILTVFPKRSHAN